MGRRKMSEASRATPGWKKRTGEWVHESGAKVKRGMHGWVAYLPSGGAMRRPTNAGVGCGAQAFIPRFPTAREAAEAVISNQSN